MAERVVFLFNLLQDVNILRPLVLMTHRETDRPILFLVSKGFRLRDKTGSWRTEISKLRKATDAQESNFASPAEALVFLLGNHGVIFAGSESDLSAHHETHDVFRAAPPGYLKVTLQHGLECVGFHQTAEHIQRYGRNVGFAADVVCSWQFPDRLTAMKQSERPKVVVTGPPSLLNRRQLADVNAPRAGGLICENLHSVRLQSPAAHDKTFMATFREFCAIQEQEGRSITLRPHPGGQYVLKKNIPLPRNVMLNNLPIYRAGLNEYAYGLSAPSTVVLDMVLAELPTAVWRDEAGTIDTRDYDGLTPVCTLNDWLAFTRDVRVRPEMLRDRQARWLASLGIQLDAKEAYWRFAHLIIGRA